jgi:hypothetical protein
MTDLPKGFYIGPDGIERFWDGEEWHDSTQNHERSGVRKAGLLTRFSAFKTSTRILIIAVASVLILSGLGGGVAAITTHNQENAAQELQQLEDEQQIRAAEESAAKNKREVAARAAAADRAAKDDLIKERDVRKATVTKIEASVKAMADQHAADGAISGPILTVRCTTTGGISIEDISIRSMLFECFASNHVNEDGTSGGFYYHARADWDANSWTYGFGRS